MKKTLLICAVLCLALAIAAPAMALDTKFSGSYRVRGYHTGNLNLQDYDHSNSYMDMRLRVQTDFAISDNLSLTTRFDALDNKLWGNNDLDGTRGEFENNSSSENIDWDRAFMTIRGDFGTFNIGRRQGGTWGTLFNDTEGERDRIQYIKGIGDLTVIAIYEKNAEQDGFDTTVSDQDFNIYYLAPYYKMENVTFGMLYGYVFDKTNRVTSDNDVYHLFVPYAVGQFGPFGFQSELRYNGFGDREYVNGTERDIEQLAWNLEGSWSMDMFKFELGWAHVDGQDANDDDIVGYGGAIGDDWQKVWILTSSEDDILATGLGGVGNLSTAGGTAVYGADLFYGGVTVMPMEGLDIGFLIAYGEADETDSAAVPVAGADDEYGWEYNLTLNYQIYDNLAYSFIAAYLDAGDFWADRDAGDAITSRNLEDTVHLFHALTLKF